jgi:hypothetical protein
MILSFLFLLIFGALIVILFCGVGLYIIHIYEKEEKLNKSKKTK